VGKAQNVEEFRIVMNSDKTTTNMSNKMQKKEDWTRNHTKKERLCVEIKRILLNTIFYNSIIAQNFKNFSHLYLISCNCQCTLILVPTNQFN